MPDKVLSSIQVFKSPFVNEIKNLGINIAYKKIAQVCKPIEKKTKSQADKIAINIAS